MTVLTNTQSNILEDGLVNHLPGNDQHHFSKIYDMYAARLYGLILKWTKRKETAEILLHDAFVKAWQNRSLFDADNENLFCWLCSMARTCYNEKLK